MSTFELTTNPNNSNNPDNTYNPQNPHNLHSPHYTHDPYNRIIPNKPNKYRGYGSSSGEDDCLNEKGLMIDAECAVEWLRARTDIDVNNIVLFGR